MSDQDFVAAAANLTPDVITNLRRAIELGKWPDGRMLSREQRETCLQAVLAWEQIHLPEEQRTGYIAKPDCATDGDQHEQPVNWRH